MSSLFRCVGHRHGPKFNHELFHGCARCKHLDANGKPAPPLSQWIGVCPILHPYKKGGSQC